MLTYFLFAAGLVLLLFGGDWLVRGAVGLAEKLGIPHIIIGLTIVAFGTSAPELLISMRAALAGSGGLAVGNVVGSNIANVLLVLGLPALIASMTSPRSEIKTTLFFLVILTLAFMWMIVTGPIGRLDGFVLLFGLAAFLLLQYVKARQHDATAIAGYEDEVEDVPNDGLKIAIYVVGGLILLPAGAALTVDAAVEIAERWNVSQDVIGLTIVAIGTSLPELATGVMAARNNSASVAIGNVVGSNLFNIAAIMGLTAAVVPVSAGDHIANFDMWIMLATTLFLVVLPYTGIRIGRTIGSILLLFYAAYLTVTVML